LTQTARNSANAPLVMHWRKWTVKFKVGEREFYYGLMATTRKSVFWCIEFLLLRLRQHVVGNAIAARELLLLSD
jgi:hypothetical protein